eukprot:5646107-Amphidinium_carterae.1
MSALHTDASISDGAKVVTDTIAQRHCRVRKINVWYGFMRHHCGFSVEFWYTMIQRIIINSNIATVQQCKGSLITESGSAGSVKKGTATAAAVSGLGEEAAVGSEKTAFTEAKRDQKDLAAAAAERKRSRRGGNAGTAWTACPAKRSLSALPVK